MQAQCLEGGDSSAVENGLRIRAVLTRNELAFPAILFHVLVVVPRGTFAFQEAGVFHVEQPGAPDQILATRSSPRHSGRGPGCVAHSPPMDKRRTATNRPQSPPSDGLNLNLWSSKRANRAAQQDQLRP